jgi:hypothetical protein
MLLSRVKRVRPLAATRAAGLRLVIDVKVAHRLSGTFAS